MRPLNRLRRGSGDSVVDGRRPGCVAVGSLLLRRAVQRPGVGWGRCRAQRALRLPSRHARTDAKKRGLLALRRPLRVEEGARTLGLRNHNPTL